MSGKKSRPSAKLIYSGGNRNDSVLISGGFESIHRKRWRLVHLPIILSGQTSLKTLIKLDRKVLKTSNPVCTMLLVQGRIS